MKNFKINIFISFVLNFILFISGFIIPSLLIQQFGSSVYGLTILLNSFLSYFNLAEAGLTSVSVYSLFRPLKSHDNIELLSTYKEIVSQFNKASFVFSCLLIMFISIGPLIVPMSNFTFVEISFLILIMGINQLINLFLTSKYKVILLALQKNYVINLALILSTLVNLILVFSFISFNNLFLIKFISLFSYLFVPFILYLYTNTYLKEFKNNFTFKFINKGPKMLKNRSYAMFLQVLGLFQSSFISILVVYFSSLETLALYSIFMMIYNSVSSFQSAFSTGISSKFGLIIAYSDKPRFTDSFNEFEFLMLSTSALMFSLTYLLIPSFISVYAKSFFDFSTDYSTISLLLFFNFFVSSLRFPFTTLISSSGLFKETTLATLVQTTLIIIFSFFLGFLFGINGVLIGLLISNIYRTFEVLFFIPRNLKIFDIKINFRRILLYLGYFLTALILKPLIPIFSSSYFEWLLIAFFLGSILLMLYFLSSLVFERRTINEIFKKNLH